MPDYKSMYYYLAGRMASAIDTLEATTEMLEANVNALTKVKEKLKLAQQSTEELFIESEEEDLADDKME